MKKDKKNQIKQPQKEIKKPLPLWWWLAGIVLLTIIAYLSVFNNGFAWDDTYYVTNNHIIRSLSLQSIFSFFTSLHELGNYHPLTLLSLAVDYKLFGLNAMGYHVVNIFFHLLNVCLVFLLIQKLFKTKFITVLTTALFAIHPMHVESVAWVSERKDVLYVFFYLWGLWCYVKYIDDGKRKYIIYTVICFVLSLLSKAQAVTFPLALMLIDYIRNGKLSIKSVLTKTPLLALSLIAGIVAIYAQKAVHATELELNYSVIERIVLTSYAFALYILKLLLPFNLAVLYPYPDIVNGTFNAWVYLSLIITVGYAILMWLLRKNKIVLSGLLFFLLNITLLLQILPVGNAIIAERYSYLSYLGLFWVIAYALHYSIKKIAKGQFIITTICCGYLIVLCYLSFERIQVWQDNATLWGDDLSKFSNVPEAWYNLGLDYQDKNDPSNAKICFSHAISIDTAYSVSYSSRSLSYFQLRMYDSAISDANRALKIQPDNKAAHQNRELSYIIVGKADSAIIDCNWILAHYPNGISAHYNRGCAYLHANKPDSALADFDWTISRNPVYENAYSMRGVAYLMLNRMPQALDDYNRAITLKPDDWQVYGNRARAWLLAGDNEKAIEDATTSIENSNNSLTNNIETRAQAYYNACRYQQALQDYLRLQQMGITLSPTLIPTLTEKAKGK